MRFSGLLLRLEIFLNVFGLWRLYCGLCLLVNLYCFRWLVLVVFCEQAGGSPAARHFSLLRQRKVTKRKATRSLGPFGQPALR